MPIGAEQGILVATLALAALVQGVAGFGFGLVAMAVLPAFLPLAEAVPVVALLGLGTNVTVIVANRRGIDRSIVLPLVAGVCVGTPFGVLLLSGADPRLLHALLGLVLVGYALQALVLRDARDAAPRGEGALAALAAACAGTLGGVLGGAFTTSGPPIVLYAAWRRLPPATARANMQCAFLVSSLCQIALFALAGSLTRDIGAAVLRGVPAVLVGLVAGVVVGRRVDARTFRRVVLVLLLVLGVRFLVGAWRHA